MAGSAIHINYDLLLQVINGDELAFREVYDLFKGKIFAYAYKHTKSKEQSAEVVQDVFIKLWQARAGINIGSPLEGYIMRITQNHLFNLMRDTARDVKKRSILFEYVQHIQENPEVDLFAKELHKTWQKAIEQLPPQKKIIYKLNKEQSLSYADIANRLNLSPLTVKKHMTEATRQIRDFMRMHSDLSYLIIAAYISGSCS